tara:strand:- start:2554 stop:3342 length:789 start_codon:yes stop_codon:yes gene_type:complete
LDLIDLVRDKVKIVYEGSWEENQVTLNESLAFIPDITQEMIDVANDRFLKRKENNPDLFDGQTMHLDLDCSFLRPDCIVLSVGKISYSIFDIARIEYKKRFGWENLPSGMGINAVVVSSDKKIAMVNRFPHLDHPERISVAPGGVYKGLPPFQGIREELQEELGIKKDELKKNVLIGISNRLSSRVNHELSFLMETFLSSVEMKERAKKAKESDGELFFLNKEEKELHDYLRENYEMLIPTGFSALVMAGRHWWSSQWSRIR